MDVYCGIDWAEDHHDVALAGRDGQLLARRRISDDAAGLARCWTCSPSTATAPKPRSRWPSRHPAGCSLPACAPPAPGLPHHPMAVARYRDRHSVSGRKSDHGDSVVLAHVLRTDMDMHRPLPADSELAQAIAVLPAPSKRRSGPHHRAQQAPLPPARVLSRLPGRLRLPQGRHHAPRGPRLPGRRAHPGRRRPAHPGPAPRPAEEAAAAAASTPKPPGCSTPSARSRCASSRSSSRPWDGRPWPCSASSTPPAPPPPTSSMPSPSLLTCTRTPGSSPASQGSARLPAPGCSPRSATTDPGSPMPKDSRPTPAPPPSPAPAAKPGPSPTARSRTTGWPPPVQLAFSALTASPGARAHYDRRRDTETGTPLPSATCSAACSAASTTA